MYSGVPDRSLYSVVPVRDYSEMHLQIVKSSLAERRSMKGIPPERTELIVVAFVLIDFIIRNAGIRDIITSAYAMKEGILYEMTKDSRSSVL